MIPQGRVRRRRRDRLGLGHLGAGAETADPGAALAAGELKFRSFGEKLRGRFTIVRTDAATSAERSAGEPWLLIHKRDECADPGWDVDALPRSVKTGRTNDEVKAGVPAIWIGRAPAAEAGDRPRRGRRRSPPRVRRADARHPGRPAVQRRGLALRAEVGRLSGGGAGPRRPGRIWTRNRQDAAGATSRSWRRHCRPGSPREKRSSTARWSRSTSAVEPDFSLLQDRAGMRGLGAQRGERRQADPEQERPRAPLVYHVFDLLHHEGRSLLEVPLEERKKLLRTLLRDHAQVRYLSHITEDGEDFHAAAKARGLEGGSSSPPRGSQGPTQRSWRSAGRRWGRSSAFLCSMPTTAMIKKWPPCRAST